MWAEVTIIYNSHRPTTVHESILISKLFVFARQIAYKPEFIIANHGNIVYLN